MNAPEASHSEHTVKVKPSVNLNNTMKTFRRYLEEYNNKLPEQPMDTPVNLHHNLRTAEQKAKQAVQNGEDVTYTSEVNQDLNRAILNYNGSTRQPSKMSGADCDFYHCYYEPTPEESMKNVRIGNKLSDNIDDIWTYRGWLGK